MSGLPLPARVARLGRSLRRQMTWCVETHFFPFHASLDIILEHADPTLTVQVEVKKSLGHDDDEPALGARRSKFDAEKQ